MGNGHNIELELHLCLTPLAFCFAARLGSFHFPKHMFFPGKQPNYDTCPRKLGGGGCEWLGKSELSKNSVLALLLYSSQSPASQALPPTHFHHGLNYSLTHTLLLSTSLGKEVTCGQEVLALSALRVFSHVVSQDTCSFYLVWMVPVSS